MKHLGRLNVFIANVDIPYVEDETVRAKYKERAGRHPLLALLLAGIPLG